MIAAVLFLRRGYRRYVAPAAIAGVVAIIPWELWARAHSLPNSFLRLSSLGDFARNIDRLGPVLSHMARNWPGPKPLPAILIIAAVVLVLAAGRYRRPVGLVLTSFVLQMAALIFIYIVAPESGDRFWRSNMARVMLTPGALVWIVAVLAVAFTMSQPATPKPVRSVAPAEPLAEATAHQA